MMNECHQENQAVRRMIESFQVFFQNEEERCDHRLTEEIRLLTGAGYAMFNLFEDDGGCFTTVAFAGSGENLRQTAAHLGFQPMGSKWTYNPEWEAKLSDEALVTFDSLRDLTGTAISGKIIEVMEERLGIREAAVVRVKKGGKIYGDFILLMPLGETVQNPDLAVVYARHVGWMLERDHAKRELIEDCQKQMQSNKDKLARQERLFSKFSRLSPGFLNQYQLFPDGTHKYLYVSDSIRDYYEVSPEDAMEDATPIFQRVHPDDYERIKASMEKARQQESIWQEEFRVILPQKGLRWYHGVSQTEKQPDGSVIWHGYTTDITKLKRAETAFSEANRNLEIARETADAANQAKSQFLAKMSHEIRTPINGIMGFIELLEGTDISEEQSEYITYINRSADDLMTIINDILDISKIESGKMELESRAFDLRSTVEAALLPLKSHALLKKVELRTTFHPNVPDQVIGDSTRLKQVLVNLAGNAIKFTEHGWVEVTVQPIENGIVQFTVEDTGIGMKPETVENLFKPYTQADSSIARLHGGTGLGLAITYEIIDLMGGSIEVESELEIGSIFRVKLPFSSPKNEDGKKPYLMPLR